MLNPFFTHGLLYDGYESGSRAACCASSPKVAHLAVAVSAHISQAVGIVIINEVNTANTMGLRDEDGDPKDWIELYNPTGQAVDLSGAGLSNKSATPFKWVFPGGGQHPGQWLFAGVGLQEKPQRGWPAFAHQFQY